MLSSFRCKFKRTLEAWDYFYFFLFFFTNQYYTVLFLEVSSYFVLFRLWFSCMKSLSWSGLQWIECLSWEHWACGRNTPWMGHDFTAGDSYLQPHTHSQLGEIDLSQSTFWHVFLVLGGNWRTRKKPRLTQGELEEKHNMNSNLSLCQNASIKNNK